MRDRVVGWWRWALAPLVALPLYVEGLWRWPLWDAEMWTIRVAELPLSSMLSEVALDKHPPLFFVLEWLLLRIHSADWVARLPAAAASLATIVVTQRLVHRHVGPLAAWVAGLLVAFSPFMAVYAANARSGPVTALLGALVLGACLDLVLGDRPKRAALTLGVASVIGLYTHYSLLLAWSGAAAGGLFGLLARGDLDRPERRRRLLLLAAALGASIAAFVPWVLGFMTQQGFDEDTTARNVMVLRYLLWPVGPDYIPSGAFVLAALATAGAAVLVRLDGRGGVVLGWSIAALAVPLAWSDNRYAVGKFYLYAPLFPIFAALVGAAVARILRGRLARPGLVEAVSALVVAALCVPPLAVVLPLPSNLVSVAPVTPGVYDPRLEARVLRSVLVEKPERIAPGARIVMDWLHYEPSLGYSVGRAGPDAWFAQDRHAGSSSSAAASGACVFRRAFGAVLTVPDPMECRAVLQAIATAGAETGHAPFLLEVAGRLRDVGNLPLAETLARRAAAAPSPSVDAALLLVDLLMRRGLPREAALVARDGGRKAARFGKREDWRTLAMLRLRAAEAAGDEDEVEDAQEALSCLERHLYSLSERRCALGLASFL